MRSNTSGYRVEAILSIVALLSCAAANSNSYSLSFDRQNPNILRVKAELLLVDSVLYSSHEGADPAVWVPHFTNLTASNAETGAPIEVTKCGFFGVVTCRPKYNRCQLLNPMTCPGFRPGGGKWKVEAKSGTSIRLTYEVNLDFSEQDIPGGIDSAPYLTTTGQYLVGRAMFLANGIYDQQRPATITFNGSGFKHLVSPWKNIAAGILEARSIEDLQESILLLGQQPFDVINNENLTIRLVTNGPGSKQVASQLTTTLNAVVGEYFQIAGTPPKDADRPITLVATVSEQWPSDGEVIGRNISLILQSENDKIDWERASFIFAHEIFHLWNHQTIVPASDEVEWFREGMTDFFALQALSRSGNIDPQILAAMYQREFFVNYETNPGHGEISILQAGKDKEKYQGILYIGGCYLGMLMEEGLKKQGHSTEDIFRALIANGRPYTLDDVLNAIAVLSEETRDNVELALKSTDLNIQWSDFSQRIENL